MHVHVTLANLLTTPTQTGTGQPPRFCALAAAEREELRGGGVGRHPLRRERLQRGEAREGEREERQQREL